MPYGHSSSTVFGTTKESAFRDFDEDDDPVILMLRLLNYRYIRFCYQPLRDKFVTCSKWRVLELTDTSAVRTGLDAEERSRRELLFGSNEIAIQEKSTPQLLVDEVCLSEIVAL